MMELIIFILLLMSLVSSGAYEVDLEMRALEVF